MVLICTLSCNQKREHPIHVRTLNSTRPIKELKELVLLKGDTVAYDELWVAFMNEKYNQEYLIYSIVMADRYNYPHAFFLVYYCLTSVFEYKAGVIDEETKTLAIKYLKRGVDLKDCNSTKELGNLYLEGKYVPKDTIMGKKFEQEGRRLCGF